MKIKKQFTLVAAACCMVLSASAQGPDRLWGATLSGGDGFGVVYTTDANGNNQVTTDLLTIPGVSGIAGRYGQLTEANGLLYGVGAGYINSLGLIYSFDPITDAYTVLASFTGANGSFPEGGMMRASNGLFYGVTSGGGSANMGTLYEFDAATNTITVRKHFTGQNGRGPCARPIQVSNGKIYGTTTQGGSGSNGVLYEFDPATNVFTLKMYFDASYSGSSPFAGMVEANGKLYGMSTYGGVYGWGILFEYNFISNIFLRKVNFNMTNGGVPYGSLTLNTDGILVGMTERGGVNDNGVIFEYNPITNVYTKTFDFDVLTSGSAPRGQMILAADGLMYGLTSEGFVANNSGGVLFSYNPATNVYTVKQRVAGGGFNWSSLYEGSDGKLYGFNSVGGLNGYPGSIFTYDIANDELVTRVNFNIAVAPDGGGPRGTIVAGANGKLYTTLYGGGAFLHGTLIEVDPSFNGGTIIKLMDFRDTVSGRFPEGALLQHSNGKLYGTTTSGGSYNGGVLFEYDVSTDSFAKKHEFSGLDGETPAGEIVEGPGSKVYGVTRSGGINNRGVIYEYDPSTDVFTKLYELDSAAGFNPRGITLHSNGKLYGVASARLPLTGGIFEYDLVTHTYTRLFGLSPTDGRDLQNTLTEAPNGKLYGVASGGGAYNKGTIFEYDPVTSTFTKTHDFTGGTGGSAPVGVLTLSPGGKLYGTVTSGGAANRGFFYEYDYATYAVTTKFDFMGPNGYPLYYGGRMAVTCEPVINTPQPDAVSLCVGDALNLSAGTTSSLYSYQWLYNNLPISGAITPTYSVANTVLADAGNYSCQITNTCRTATMNIAVNIDSVRSVTSAPGPISGVTDVCPIAGTLLAATYTIPPVSGNEHITWVVPAGATLVSGQGTDTIVVRFSETYTSGAVKVNAVYACGPTSAFSTLEVSKTPPAVPSAINGPKSNLCPGVNYTYSVPPVAGATSYIWTTPPNSTVVSGQGTSSLTLKVTGAFVYGALSVKTDNGCAVSALYTVTLFMKPTTPGAITGNKNVCAYLGGAPQTYSIPVIAGITNYIWTIPAGCTIVSGQGTTSISVSYPIGFTSGNISVVADGTCYNSVASTIAVTAGPPQPGGITGDATVCSQITSHTAVAYSIVPVTGATSYNWIVPVGASILSGQGTRFASILFDSSLVSGTDIKVAAVNGCMAGLYRTLAITGCPSSPRLAGTQETDSVSAITIYPNPASEVLNINVPSDCNSEMDVELYDVSGNLIRRERRVVSEGSNTLSINISDLANGLYFVRLSSLSGEAGEMKPFIRME